MVNNYSNLKTMVISIGPGKLFDKFGTISVYKCNSLKPGREEPLHKHNVK